MERKINNFSTIYGEVTKEFVLKFQSLAKEGYILAKNHRNTLINTEEGIHNKDLDITIKAMDYWNAIIKESTKFIDKEKEK